MNVLRPGSLVLSTPSFSATVLSLALALLSFCSYSWSHSASVLTGCGCGGVCSGGGGVVGRGGGVLTVGPLVCCVPEVVNVALARDPIHWRCRGVGFGGVEVGCWGVVGCC